MSFTQSTFATVGAQSTDTPTVYSYKSLDSLGTIKGADYFVDKTLQVEAGDMIVVTAADGNGLLQIQADKSTAANADFIAQPTNQVNINALSDFPAPVAGLITLVASTKYFVGSDVSIGTNRLDQSAGNISVSGSESINTSLTYTGTGDMFTITNARARINNLTLNALTGRVINFSDNTDTIFRMNDCSVNCDKFGLFNSSGPNGSTTRFTAVSPSSIITSGCEITGGWNTWLWEVSAANLAAGDLFDFGTATFDQIVLDLILADLSAGANLIKGTTASANINVGGSAIITRMLTGGAGTTLDTVTTDDIRWIFSNNDDIADTSPDALLTLAGNATETVIGSAGVGVLANASTWVVDSISKFVGTTAGRATFKGERTVSAPIDISAGLKSATGNFDAFLSVAINGVIKISGVPVAISSSKPTAASVIFQEKLSEDDFVELFVTNKDSTVNIIVTDAILRVL